MGKSSNGTKSEETSVRRSRNASRNSLRYTTAMFGSGISANLLGDVVRGDDLDEDLLEVLRVIAGAELGDGAFGEELAGLDDADDVAELLDLAHDVGGEDDGL